MRVMILGASGYLGQKIMRYLLAEKYDVTGVYRVIPTEEGVGETYRIRAELEEIRAELQKKRYDWIVNCAAVYERQNTAIHEVVDANMIFALRVLNCAVECGVLRFLTIDTSLPSDLNLYSFTKQKFKEFGKFYAEKYGITFVNVLLEMFYGEDEPEGRFLVGCCKKMIRGEELLLTEGTQRRDIVYIDDVCNAIKLLLEATLMGFCDVPVGSGEAVPVRNLIEYMHKVTGSQSLLKFGAIPQRVNEPDCVANMEMLNEIGFVLKYPWRQGIKHICERIKAEE